MLVTYVPVTVVVVVVVVFVVIVVDFGAEKCYFLSPPPQGFTTGIGPAFVIDLTFEILPTYLISRRNLETFKSL